MHLVATFAVKAVRGFLYTIAVVIILAAIAVSVSRLFAPMLNSHRADFEARANQLLNMPVTIQNIRISWNIFQPQLTFEHIAIFDKETGKQVFQIQRVHLRLSLVRSLIHWKLVLDKIKVDGMRLILHQRQSGELHLEGLGNFALDSDMKGASLKTNGVIAWVFSQSNLILDNVNIRYISAKGEEQLFTLYRLNLTNSNINHILVGQITLHQIVPTTATFGLKWRGNDVADISHISAQIYLYLEAISLPQWLNKFSWNHLQIKEGLGSAKIWMNWDHGQWQMIQSKFQVYELELQSLITKQSQVISRLSGRVGWKQKGAAYEFFGDDILIDFPQHLWPTTHFSATIVPTADNAFGLQTLHVGYLDLGDIKGFALTSGLLPESIKKWIVSLNPTGEMLGLTVNSHLPIMGPQSVAFFSGFSQLGVKEVGKFPGFDHLSGTVSWDGKQGSIKLDSTQLIVTLNSLFSNSLQFNHASAKVQIQKEADQSWNLIANNIQVENADAKAHADVTLKIPLNDSPSINLLGDFSVANGPKIIDYLPVKVWDSNLRKWLKHAVLQGQVTSGKAILEGKLSDFPFDQGTGKFEINGIFNNVDLNYAPGWPMIQHVNGSLTFNNASMYIDVSSGQILNTQVTNVKAAIPYIGNDAPQTLSVQAAVKSDFTEGFKLIQQSPLKNTIGKDLENMHLTGPMQLKLDLSVPLGKPDDTSVAGDVSAVDANLNLPLWKLTFEKINGSFQFTESSVSADRIQAELLNELVDLNITTIHPTEMPGFVKIDLHSKISIPSLQSWLGIPLNRILQGETNYHAVLNLTSHTQAKPTQMNFSSDLYGISVALPAPYGKKAHEKKNFELALSALNGKISQVSIKLVNLLNADMRYQSNNQMLAIDLNGQQIAGRLTLPLGDSQQPVIGRFKRISFSSTSGERNQGLFNPSILPPLDIVADNVYYGDKNFGRIILHTEPDKTQMIIKQFIMELALMRLSARGNWELKDSNYHTSLLGDIKISNMGNLLSSWDIKSSLVGSGGEISFNLTWGAPPYQPAVKNMNGDFSLRLTKGRIIDLGSSTTAKIDFGRMLNIFSLQTIPRRLSLDFSDLFEQGYSFDSMKGDFKLRNGNAFTHNAKFDGPIARVDIFGRVGLADEDYDLTLSVTPYVTSSLPVVAGLAGGPLALIATWVADKVVTHEVSKVATYHYLVTGTWDAPVWKQTSS
jgi:uncharacterized protein (TIGR02099 family)